MHGKEVDLIDETGNTYGRLTVLSFKENKKYIKFWNCICECGNKIPVRQSSLRNGQTQSCGCLRSDRTSETLKKYDGSPALNKIITGYIVDAKRRGHEWSLPREVAIEILQRACYYCGEPPKSIVKYMDYTEVYNGIDRLDNFVGYKEGNVVTCCKTCNLAKRDMSELDFLKWIERVYRCLHSQ